MNNVLEDSLFVSQNKKFDEIQSIIKDNIFAVIQNYARKKLRGSGFAVQSMMMNMGVDFLKAGYDFCVRKYGTSTQDHLDAMSTLSKMYEHAYGTESYNACNSQLQDGTVRTDFLCDFLHSAVQ